MKIYITKRIIQAFFCIFVITIVIFMLTRLSGDPALLMVGPEASDSDIAAIRVSLGLDKPLYVQYWSYISNILRGDFGRSLRWGVPTLVLFGERFVNTLKLGAASMVFALFFGIPVGVLSAVKVGRWFDTFGKVFALLGQALPVFWLGIMLMTFLSVYLKLLPTSGIGGLKHLVMPAITLGWYFTASLVRVSRSAMLDVLDTEYIKMARLKGVAERWVIMKHALKNAMIPIATLGAINFVILLNGTVITETVFNYPGVGKLVVDAIFKRDFPVVQTCVLISSCLFIFTNLFIDIFYSYVDPRIKYE
ncbi:MAG: ABC transporter permease [Deltaproteobacteria bacterium]|nr:ABC transporter permease [Deltaproteobacteria bacterium]